MKITNKKFDFLFILIILLLSSVNLKKINASSYDINKVVFYRTPLYYEYGLALHKEFGMDTKICKRCKRKKMLSDFYFHKRKKDNLDIYCILCVKKMNRLSYKKRYIKKGYKRKDTSHLKLLTRIEKSYMAGLFDGEGCIVIAEEKKKRNSCFRLQLSLGNTHKETICWIYNRFGGRVGKHPYKPPYKKVYYWTAVSLEAGDIIKTFLPYLKIKKKRALLVAEFLKLKRGNFDKKLKYKNKISFYNRRSI